MVRDIGKIAIPGHILLKPSKLDKHEIHVMRSHAEFGASILSGSKSRILRIAAEGIAKLTECGIRYAMTSNDKA